MEEASIRAVEQEQTIEVGLAADGTPVCSPSEKSVKRGDTVRWTGPDHQGRIDGRIIGAKQRGYTEKELSSVQVDNSQIPFSKSGVWGGGNPTLRVNDDAEPGAYKYSVTVGSKTTDPVIIIEP